MPLSAGTRFGPYEILAPIGAGGMGEVYRAKDTRLKRDVALKVLSEAFANDRERMARFQREAEVLAALNHPNIAQIYGVEEHALIMELVEGDPLKGPLPLETALQYAKQIADALEAAHEKGIVHRDLKPDNVMVTPTGLVKVLDFGLAAVLQGPASTAVDPANSPTLTMRATEAGMIVGTAAYMSPEQASGKPVDKRADIWSFGVVLFEMLTGNSMFGGAETLSHILADVLRSPIDLGKLPAETPPVIRELLRRCLDRDVRNRLRDIGEARVLIAKYLADPSSGAEPRTQAISLRHSKAPWAAAAAMGIIAAVAGAGWWYATRAVERPLVRLDVDLGPEVSLGSQVGADAIISPDGARLVFVSKARLFTRRLNQPKATELAGTEGASGPFFSPDGQWVAFFAGGKLKKISVEGGATQALCDAPSFRGGAWGEDHNIILALTSQGGVLSRIPDAGGAPQPLTELAQGEITHRWPQILPGGKAVLFTANAGTSGFDGANIEVMSFRDHRRKTLQQGGAYGRFLPTGARSRGAGHLVYINKGTLFAVSFDSDTWEVRGTPAPVLQEVSYSSTLGYAQFDFSQAGTLVYRSGGAGGGMVTLQWLDGGGKLQPLPAKPGPYSQLRLSPDGKLVALRVTSGNGSDIWTYDWQRDSMSHLTFGDGAFTFPAWSPDGRYLVFHAASGIFWTRPDGAGKPQPLTQTKTAQYPWSFSPEGKRLAFAESGLNGFQLWTLPVENDSGQLRAGKPEVFLQTTSASENYPVFSPDGRWIAYRSLESGISEIYVRPFPNKGRKWQVSNNGGVFAVWSRNGHELFYRTQDQQIMVASYTTKGDSFVPDKPRLWSERRLADTSFFQNLDISPDSKRFLVLMPAEAPGQQRANNQVIFLLNFFDEIRRRAPDGK
jgi:Tol biopolymer transport system component/predicted Ser/Thr protein kinase